MAKLFFKLRRCVTSRALAIRARWIGADWWVPLQVRHCPGVVGAELDETSPALLNQCAKDVRVRLIFGAPSTPEVR